ncbi:MAG TPA: S8 family peptidase, partial [Thermoleophilaceae bacterium]|nr:S8 family peptidase [Thermoleophilaceae bacterium]
GAQGAMRERVRGVVDAALKQRLPLEGMQLLSLPPGTSPQDAAARLSRQEGVEYAEPNWTRHAMATVNDPQFSDEWGLNNTGQTTNAQSGTPDADIDAPEAWDVTTGSPSVTVGVVDTGIDATHPDLSANIVPGWDFVEGDGDPTDQNGHGTHVSGTIAASGNNGIGVAGIAYSAKVMPLRVLDAAGYGNVADVVAAYQYAASHGIRIVNASLGSYVPSTAESDAMAAASGTLFVVAAGNSSSDVDQTPEYPCAYPLANIICVAATDATDNLAFFSNFGTAGVDIAAPGVNIASTWPQSIYPNNYAWLDGTSMATPHVTGVAALVASRFPQASVAALRAAVLDHTDHPAALAGKIADGRRLNAYDAVTAPPPPATTSPEPAPGSPVGAPPALPARPDTVAPVVSLRAPQRIRSATLRRQGQSVVVRCSEACRIDARLMAAGGSRTLGPVAPRQLDSAGQTRITVRPSRKALRARPRLVRPGARLRLELTATDPAGNKRKVVKTVVVTR